MIGCADILPNWIQFAQKNGFMRKPPISATIGMKHPDHSWRERRHLS